MYGKGEFERCCGEFTFFVNFLRPLLISSRLAHFVVALQLVEVKTETLSKHVDEIDVLRGQEVINRHTGKNGSFCFVVRRPGKAVRDNSLWQKNVFTHRINVV